MIVLVFSAVAILAFVGISLFQKFHERNAGAASKTLICAAIATGIFAMSVLTANITKVQCQNCNAIVTNTYCTKCGIKANEPNTCPECGKYFTTNFCGSCGTQLKEIENN